MANAARRGLKQGFWFGIAAGIIFGIMEMIGAALMGDPLLMPLRMFASVVLGQAALSTTPLSTAVIVGTIAHLVLSGIFGFVFGFIASRLSADTRRSWGAQVAIGLLFGAALWLVNFQIIARALYPWFLNTPQLLQVLMHALFFGLPLALFYASAERSAGVRRQAPTAV